MPCFKEEMPGERMEEWGLLDPPQERQLFVCVCILSLFLFTSSPSRLSEALNGLVPRLFFFKTFYFKIVWFSKYSCRHKCLSSCHFKSASTIKNTHTHTLTFCHSSLLSVVGTSQTINRWFKFTEMYIKKICIWHFPSHLGFTFVDIVLRIIVVNQNITSKLQTN